MSWIFDLGFAGLVFLGLCVWLVRKVAKAAGTEGDLEAERLQSALALELEAARPRPQKPATATSTATSTPTATSTSTGTSSGHLHQHVLEHEHEHVFACADLRGANPAHLALIAPLVAEREQTARAQHKGPSDVPRRVEVLWVRSNATHAVWCERRHAATLAARAMTRDVVCVALIERGRVSERWFFG